MVDGEHSAYSVLDDALLVYELLRIGGCILFDDVKRPNRWRRLKRCGGWIDHAEYGIKMFLDIIGDDVKLLWEHKFMQCYEKVR